MKKLQLTMAILKPDLCMRPNAKDSVKMIIKSEGFFLIRQAVVRMNQRKAQRFYAEHEGKFFHNRLVEYMCIHPMECMVLAHSNAIQQWRVLMGPTKPYIAQITAPHTIRGTYGLTDTRNSVHGSDSDESAKREIGIIFPDFSVQNWYHHEELYFRSGKVRFLREHQIHKPEI